MERIDNSETPSSSVSQSARKSNYLLGLALLLVVVVLWTVSNFLIQNLFEGGFQEPFFLTYLSTSTFALYLIPDLVSERLRNTKTSAPGGYHPLPAADSEDRESPSSVDAPANVELPLTKRETASVALTFSLLWFIANLSSNGSLGYTSVSSTTILTSTSGFFTLGIGSFFRVEKFSAVKVLAVTSSFAGAVLVSLSDSKTGSQFDPNQDRRALFGDFLALLSAIVYAVYVVFLKVQVGSESRLNMKFFFGLIGLFTATLFWPFGFILQLLGIEQIAFPHSGKEWISVLINCFITFASDFLFLVAMLKTTPLVVTVGLSMTIPAAVLGDYLLGRPAAGQALLGGLLVILGFIAVGVEDSREARPAVGNEARDQTSPQVPTSTGAET